MSRIEEKFKQLTTGTKVIILVCVFGLGFAWMFRYSAPVTMGGAVVAVTDRWTGCMVFHVMGESKPLYRSCP